MLSSHLIADIERVCDHLILLAESRVQLCGDIETLLAEHRILTGPRKDTTAIERTHTIVREETTARQTTLLVRLNGPVIDPAWAVDEPNLEEIVLGYMSQDDAGYGTGPEDRPPVGDGRGPMTWVTWRQYRHQGALAAALLAVLAVAAADHRAARGVGVALRPGRLREGRLLRQPDRLEPFPRQPDRRDARRRDVRGAAAARAVLGRPDGGAASWRPERTSSPGRRASPGGAGWRSGPDGCCSPRPSWPERSRPWSPGGLARTTR